VNDGESHCGFVRVATRRRIRRGQFTTPHETVETSQKEEFVIVGSGMSDGQDNLAEIVNTNGKFATYFRAIEMFASLQCSRHRATCSDAMNVGEVEFELVANAR
jgi:hypothetical protein